MTIRLPRLLRKSGVGEGDGGCRSAPAEPAPPPPLLLEQAIAANGGFSRLRRVKRVEAELSVAGASSAAPGWLDQERRISVHADGCRQLARMSPFPASGLTSVWEPGLIEIERDDGSLVEDRVTSRTCFATRAQETRWNRLHLASFLGGALWHLLTAPIALSWRDVRTEELTHIIEGGERRRRLLVRYPERSAPGGGLRLVHLDDAGLIRRVDHRADDLAAPEVSYVMDAHREFDGLMFPTLVLARSNDGRGEHDRDAMAFSISISHVRTVPSL